MTEQELLALIARLAPEDGVYDGELGYCMLCRAPGGVDSMDAWRGELEEHHAADCPWVEARKLLTGQPAIGA